MNKGIESVPGIGTRDNFPAMLTPGEGVVDAKTNQKLVKALKEREEQQNFLNPTPQEVTVKLDLDADGLGKFIEAEIISNERLGATGRAF